jgi:hypothetical protein
MIKNLLYAILELSIFSLNGFINVSEHLNNNLKSV